VSKEYSLFFCTVFQFIILTIFTRKSSETVSLVAGKIAGKVTGKSPESGRKVAGKSPEKLPAAGRRRVRVPVRVPGSGHVLETGSAHWLWFRADGSRVKGLGLGLGLATGLMGLGFKGFGLWASVVSGLGFSGLGVGLLGLGLWDSGGSWALC
jgi:hypothetical protein